MAREKAWSERDETSAAIDATESAVKKPGSTRARFSPNDFAQPCMKAKPAALSR